MLRPVGRNTSPLYPEDKGPTPKTSTERLQEPSLQRLRQNVEKYVIKKIAKTKENMGFAIKITGGFTFVAAYSDINKKDSFIPEIFLRMAAGLYLVVAGNSLEKAGKKKYETILQKEHPPEPPTPEPFMHWEPRPLPPGRRYIE